MNIEWYPGHMTKARRQMEEDLKLVDLIVEIRDARIPLSSANPDLIRMGNQKLRLIILNKADLADPAKTSLWIEKLRGENTSVLETDSKLMKDRNRILQAFETAARPKRERDRKRGLRNRPIRAMVVGIPNVGKSTFINLVTKKSQAKTGNKPGVTRGKQWIHTSQQIDLLDTPGILWPKFESEEVGLHLAMCGAISDERIPMEELACRLIDFLREDYPKSLEKRFFSEDHEITKGKPAQEVLSDLAGQRKILLPGGELNTERMAEILMMEFRTGKLGRISLEVPGEES